MLSRRVVFPLLISCAFIACTRIHAAESPACSLSENDKIERLISSVENLDGATFIRKGSEYDAATAAKFLRGKWSYWKDSVQTARDFITLASAGNFGTGSLYYIKYKDGTQVTSADYLTTQLAKLEAPAATQPSSH